MARMNFVPLNKDCLSLVNVMAEDRHYLYSLRQSPPRWANHEALHAALDAIEKTFSDPSVVRTEKVMNALFRYSIGLDDFPERHDQSARAVAIRAYVGVEQYAKLRTIGYFILCMLAGAAIAWGLVRVFLG